MKVWSGILFVSAVLIFSFANSAKADSGTLGAGPDVNAGSAGKIAAAYSSEAISLETFVVQSLKSYFLPDQVDARFASAIPNQPTRDITPLLDLARIHYDEFSAESRAFLDSLMKRPDEPTYTWHHKPYPLFYLPMPVSIYVSGNFVFHYVDHATPDTAGTVHQTTLAFVKKIAASFTEVVAKSITGDGYSAPPDDPGGLGCGGDTKFDVYIMNTGRYNVYGFVPGEGLAAGEDGNSYYSFMVLDNDFTEFVKTDTFPETAEEVMQVTVAHEFHHAIQNGVNGNADIWYKECTSTWNERNVYPAIKDNLQYLNGAGGFFVLPWVSLDTADDNWYKTWLWNEFLTIKYGAYGAGTVKKVWDNLDPNGSNNAVTALNTFITGKGSTLLKDFRTWAAKNYSQLGFYADAALYDAMKFDINVDHNGGNPYTVDYTAGNTSKSATVDTMQPLSAQYAQVVPGATLTKPTTLSIQVEGPLGKDVTAIAIAKNKSGTFTEYPIDMVDDAVSGKKKGSCGVSGFCTANISEVAIALVNASKVPADGIRTMSFTASLAKPITFCIDDTGSMGSAISGAKAAVNKVLDANKTAKIDGTATDTYFYTLFSFKDGAGTLRGQSSDEDTMKSLVATLSAEGGGSNPESSLTTIRQATRIEEGADILMMTDAVSNSYGVDNTAADWGEVLETIYALVNANCRLHVIYFADSTYYRTAARSATDNNGNPITLPKEGVGSLGYSCGAEGYARIATESGGLFFADIYGSVASTKAAEIILRTSGSAGTFAFMDGTRTDTALPPINYIIPVDNTVRDLQITLNGNPGSAVTLAVKNPAGDTLTTGTGVFIITTSGTTCYLISGAKVTSGNWTAIVSGKGSYRVIATGSTSNPMGYTGNNTVGKNGTLNMSATFRTAVPGATFVLNNLDGSVYKPVTLTTSDGGRNYTGAIIMSDLGSYRFSASASGFLQRTSSQKIIVGSISVTAPAPVRKKPNDTFTHTFVIRNLSTDTAITDTFTIYVTSSLGWSDTSKNNTLVPLKGGASSNLVINVTVPATAVSGDIDTLSVSAVNQANPLISGNAQTETRYTTVALDIITTILPGGSVGVAYRQSVLAVDGVGAYHWSISAGSLPVGLALNANTGAITGIPTTVGVSRFTVRVADSKSPTPVTAARALSIVINPILTITTSSLSGGSVGAAYSQNVSATGGVIPYIWSISSGSLPVGLYLNAGSGVISGTPTAVGASSFIIRVVDSQSPTSATTTKALSIAISPAFIDSEISLTNVNNSSLAWGDYDNDGDLDLALGGWSDSGYITEIYWNNGKGTFTDIGAGLPGVDGGSLAWGDYDNDGDLDLAVSGETGSGGATKIYQNNSGIFADISAGLTGVTGSSLAWGDYDNDGDLDLAVSGNSGSGGITKIYQNTGGAFTAITASLPGVSDSSLSWGDYDNDGDLDLVVSGYTGSGLITKIYQNTGGVFNDITAGLAGVRYGSLSWGDYDNDGDLDLAVCGWTGSGLITKIYQNTGGAFTDIGAAGLTGVYYSSLAWGDYNNDGDLDLAVCGYTDLTGITKIYQNTGGIFADISAGLTGLYYSSLAWGDYNNDGDLDLAMSGNTGSGYITKIYKNLEADSVANNGNNNPNEAPFPPADLTKNQTGSTILLKWNPGSDSDTPDTGLYYNLRLGTTPGSNNIVSGLYGSPLLGNYLRPKLSASQLGVKLKNLPSGTYYWSVQAIDTGLKASAWSAEATFGGFLTITTTALPAGTKGAAYSQGVSATGGITPYTWSVSAGSLPAGLALNAGTGAITGTPTTTIGSPFNFTVRVADSQGTPAIATKTLSIVIKPAALTTGDINGDGLINITDVILCLRQAIGLDPANPALADMNGDGVVNITDVILILRKAIGLDTRKSAE